MNKRKRRKAAKASAGDMQNMFNEQESSTCDAEQAKQQTSAQTEMKPESTAQTDAAECEAQTAQSRPEAADADTQGSSQSEASFSKESAEQIEAVRAEYEEKIAKLTDQLKRSMAEFDNYRKRTEQEKLSMFDRGVSSVAEKILPTVDNFERAMASEPDSEEAKAFVSGMELVYKSFMKTLEDIGIKPIECVGREFDPNLHHAVMHEDDDSGEQNIITEEFQKGYTLKDKVIRCSMVKVKN